MIPLQILVNLQLQSTLKEILFTHLLLEFDDVVYH